jgi:hypothetical protein
MAMSVRTWIISVTCVSICTPAWGGFMTGEQLKEYLDDARAGVSFKNLTVAMGYVAGVYDMVDNSRVCISRELSVREAMEIAHRYLNAHRSELQRPAAELVVNALTEEFPCKR